MTLEEKAEAFAALVCEAARRRNCVFIGKSPQGHSFETEKLFLEDIGGWLFPAGTPEEKQKSSRFYRFAQWKVCHGEVRIDFVAY